MKEDDLTTTVDRPVTPPPIRIYELRDRDDRVVEVQGRHIGTGTSQSADKPRWFEVDIYETTDGRFVVYTRGMSNIPGEKALRRLIFTTSAFEILSLLVVLRNGRQYLTKASDRAIAQAAQWNDAIRDAYINRAVT